MMLFGYSVLEIGLSSEVRRCLTRGGSTGGTDKLYDSKYCSSWRSNNDYGVGVLMSE